MPDRRTILVGSAAAFAVAAGGLAVWRVSVPEPGAFPFELTDEEWRARLSETEYGVLRQTGTEKPFSSPLNELFEPGLYVCVGCGNQVYSSEHKYDSDTGWPSFTQATASDVVGLRPDPKIFGLATEARCARCGGHLGHVFEDGPEPTGLRHCINGVALRFLPTA